jgi:hypothetical protein
MILTAFDIFSPKMKLYINGYLKDSRCTPKYFCMARLTEDPILFYYKPDH